MPVIQGLPTTSRRDGSAFSCQNTKYLPIHYHTSINKLCPELLSEIFLHCLRVETPEDEPHILRREKRLDGGSTISRHSLPIAFTRVCRYWRIVALQYRRLWAWVNLRRRRTTGGMVPRPIQDALALSFFAERSGALEMQISLDYQSLANDDGSGEQIDGNEVVEDPVIHDESDNLDVLEDEVEALFAVIYTLRRRMQKFSMLMPTNMIYHALNQFCRTKFPRLNDLTVSTNSLPDRLWVVNLHSLPAITNVTLSGLGMRPCSYETYVTNKPQDDTDLKSITLVDCMSPHLIIVDLEATSHLRVSNLHIQFSSLGAELLSLNPLPLSHLRRMNRRGSILPTITSLTVSDAHHLGYHASLFLSAARLPSLQSLKIITPRDERLKKWHCLPFMLEKSSPPLRTLDISGTSMTSTEFVRCLRAVSETLEEIVADGALWTTFVVRALTYSCIAQSGEPADDIISCPRLTKIIFREASSCSLSAIAAMILSRISPYNSLGLAVRVRPEPCQLKEVVLSNCSEDFSKLVACPKIQDFVMNGNLTVIVQ